MALGDLTAIRSLYEEQVAIAGDGTTAYVVSDMGKIKAITISGGAIADFYNLPEKITAMCTDGTYLYVGTAKGNIYMLTIADKTKATVLEEEKINRAVLAMYVSTHLYVAFAGGVVKKVALS